MAIERKKYQTINGDIVRVRVSSEKAVLGGAEPAGARTADWFVAVTGSRRKRTGIRARNVVYTRNSGTAANPTIRTVIIPFFLAAEWATAPDTITYKGASWLISTKNNEDN